MVILALSSRFHLTVGIGLPVARHLSVTFDPSRTMTSLELRESSMFGGTVGNNFKHFIQYRRRRQNLLCKQCVWWWLKHTHTHIPNVFPAECFGVRQFKRTVDKHVGRIVGDGASFCSNLKKELSRWIKIHLNTEELCL